MARSEYVPRAFVEHLLAGLMPANAEVLRLCMDYGLRVGDVLRLRVEDLHKPYWSFKEEKTGKRRRVRLSKAHIDTCLALAGKVYVFEHRTDYKRHRTRQSVYKDIRRIAQAFHLKNVTPHSFRKIYAVDLMHETGDISNVQRRLNHDSAAVTMLYALADELSKKNDRELRKRGA